jgi:hypothetical protein
MMSCRDRVATPHPRKRVPLPEGFPGEGENVNSQLYGFSCSLLYPSV